MNPVVVTENADTVVVTENDGVDVTWEEAWLLAELLETHTRKCNEAVSNATRSHPKSQQGVAADANDVLRLQHDLQLCEDVNKKLTVVLLP